MSPVASDTTTSSVRRLQRPSTAPGSVVTTRFLPWVQPVDTFSMQTVEEDLDMATPDITSPVDMPYSSEEGYSWPTFINAYAQGQWDVHTIPQPPIPSNEYSSSTTTTPPSNITPTPPPPPPSTPTIASRSSRRPPPTKIPLPLQKPRSSMYPVSDSLANEFGTAAMRWAAQTLDFSPLTLPSPEHELTDPMRGVTTAIPGSHPPELDPELYTPGGTRKSRLGAFWRGITEPSQSQLETIEGSPSISPDPSVISNPPSSSNAVGIVVHPATVPALNKSDTPEGDYFGSADTSSPQLLNHTFVPDKIMTAPVAPRRIGVTRQSSSPFPISSSPDLRPLIASPRSDSHRPYTSKAEHSFRQLAYLIPPPPPDEQERRRALYRFNIWNTSPDINFDRIAHLCKLVFATRGVFISLIDGSEQFFKSGGMKLHNNDKHVSFCAHAILTRGDEPMVIPDTLRDWRFAQNPQVVGDPHVRFYAGAPLRTSEGFSIGTLAIIDDVPHNDFNPRQRHTLKEFAAIVVRELELWRDKIMLRIRDRIQNSMEQFSRECLEIDAAPSAADSVKRGRSDVNLDASMRYVYTRAASLIKATLDVEGVLVMDFTHSEVLESIGSADGNVSFAIYHAQDEEEEPERSTTVKHLTTEEYLSLVAFFDKNPEGSVSEGVVPACFQPFLPIPIQHALTVPVRNIDRRPFCLLCAYNTDSHDKRFLEGHELSFIRAIGVIILSAVLKRRMLLADQAKGLFISNISHELRTPLHGILASSELLAETTLTASQHAFVSTVAACSTSLVETVNHVLDFSKLSGNSHAGGAGSVILPTKTDLQKLLEEAVDGGWIGFLARSKGLESGIGSVYDARTDAPSKSGNVEVILDIGSGQWLMKIERAGLRRVFMNLFSNSLKFTSAGYILITMKQSPVATDPSKVKVELSVLDTGKGISESFLRNQLFQPFTQEKPLEAGTGLGLAIVKTILSSDGIHGEIEVQSQEGKGTEIKVSFEAETVKSGASTPTPLDHAGIIPVKMVGFTSERRGTRQLEFVLSNLLTDWGFEIVDEDTAGEGRIIILNESIDLLVQATECRDVSHPFIVLSAARGDSAIANAVDNYKRIGGFGRNIFKPVAPSQLQTVLKLCLHAVHIARAASPTGGQTIAEDKNIQPLHRRNSEETNPGTPGITHRPFFSRSITIHPSGNGWKPLPPTQEKDEPVLEDQLEDESTISVGSGSLLKTSIETVAVASDFRVLIIEDNSILRSLLARWLTSKGYDHRSASDGQEGVDVFQREGPFHVVLLDMSMPILDGLGATTAIRKFEQAQEPRASPTRILALTGMSSLDDKRKAFDAGVDGYLVKPVAFKTLQEMFHKLRTTDEATLTVQ